MINLDLIELADLSRPVEIATGIIKQNPGIQVPIPLEEIAFSAGIREINKRPLDGLEGALVANPEKSEGIILIKEDSRPQRQRFTLGHELGHFLIPRHGHQMSCGLSDLTTRDKKALSSAQRMELEANQFSAELLMPRLLVRQYPGFRGEPSIECLISMAADFSVSFEACAQRYVALHDDPVAIVFAHETVVRYSTKSEGFPFWIQPGKGSTVPVKSHSTRINTVISGSSDAARWLDSSRYFELPEEVIEEVYTMENGYTAIFLYFDEELEELEG